MDEDFRTIEFKDNTLYLIDQRVLPLRETFFSTQDYRDVEFAIRDMVVRGAPAIGAAAAYGFYLAALELSRKSSAENFFGDLKSAADFLEKARPTAVNLHWALMRMMRTAELQADNHPLDAAVPSSMYSLLETLLKEADSIRIEDIETNKKIGKIGAEVIPAGAAVLTHCNTGALATAGWGTALGVIKEAHYSGKDIFVYADETRPRLQGARLTSWELVKAGIPSKLIADNAAASLIRDGKIDCVILGADRVAANGDVCNKIGTFMLSVICKEYGVPFYSVLPVSTIDFSIASGKEIPIEERSPREITHVGETQTAPDGMDVYNPAFDVTPHQNVTGIITEMGILRPPYKEQIEKIRKAYTAK